MQAESAARLPALTFFSFAETSMDSILACQPGGQESWPKGGRGSGFGVEKRRNATSINEFVLGGGC